ncbi:MAG TPA: LPS assembly lipoprotein LptE [Gammaproteobacteria bacterium]|nr:LPS assembly lipoprotein LptE [Gammaproteobacteria bacterium]
MNRARTFVLISPLLAAALLLVGCGFQLRGALDLPDNVRTLHVIAPSELRNDIITLLESGGVGAATSGAEADASITVTSERFSRRVLSVDPTTGKEREFELAYTLDFGVTRSDGATVIENGTVNLLRDYVFDPQAVLGTSREEALLREEMRRDAARQLMRRVEAALSP